VLVVDDHELMRRMFVESLEGMGYAVLAAASGTEALNLSRERRCPIDLVITDLSMPDMNGHELADQIRLERPTIRVLFASGFPQGAHGTSVLGSNEGYLAKPFRLEELQQVVRELIDRPVESDGAAVGRLDDDRP
jgi:CheY-like chemotaxis protein